MALKDDFLNAVSDHGGALTSYSQRRATAKVGYNVGVCQALCFFDGLTGLLGINKRVFQDDETTRYAVNFQQDFERVSAATPAGWDLNAVRGKYLECIGYMEAQNTVRVGYVEAFDGTRDILRFLSNKSGYFNFLMASHVTGLLCAQQFRYFDPNLGFVRFATRQQASLFTAQYHGQGSFQTTYNQLNLPILVVQLTAL